MLIFVGEERVHGENRYSPLEHACQAGVAIEWCADCFGPDVDHAYVADPETLILRPGLPADRLNLAAAVGLAKRDLHNGQAPDGLTDPVAIAAHRLLPLPDLREAMFRHRGGITAVAADFAVPPTLVRLRLCTLSERERAEVHAAVTAAEAEEPKLPERDTLRATVRAARIAITGAVAGLVHRRKGADHQHETTPGCAPDTKPECVDQVDTAR